MKKPFQIALCLLLALSLLSTSTAFAELKTDPKQFAMKVVKKFQSVGSISSISVLGTVTGKIILSGSRRLINGSLRSIFTGNNKRPSPRKIIKVKGTNTGELISIRGIGKQNKGYSFSIVTPSIFNLYSKKSKKLSGRLSDGVEVAFDDGSDITRFESDGDKNDRFQGKRTKKKGILTGTFQKETGSGVAKGRFILKFKK